MLDNIFLQALAIFIVLLVLSALVYVCWLIIFRWLVRSSIVVLIGYYEQAAAARRSFESVLRHLINEPDDALIAFATDVDSEDRKVFSEIAERMIIVRDELDVRRLPFKLHEFANKIADSAHVLAVAAGSISDDARVEEVLDRVGNINLKEVNSQYLLAEKYLSELCAEYKIRDAAVYGGGLYI